MVSLFKTSLSFYRCKDTNIQKAGANFWVTFLFQSVDINFTGSQVKPAVCKKIFIKTILW